MSLLLFMYLLYAIGFADICWPAHTTSDARAWFIILCVFLLFCSSDIGKNENEKKSH